MDMVFGGRDPLAREREVCLFARVGSRRNHMQFRTSKLQRGVLNFRKKRELRMLQPHTTERWWSRAVVV